MQVMQHKKKQSFLHFTPSYQRQEMYVQGKTFPLVAIANLKILFEICVYLASENVHM